MLRLLFLLLLTAVVVAEEPAIIVKGQFQGKVRENTFEQPFEVRLEPGEKNEFRVEMEGVDLSLGLLPKWHYSAGNTPDGVLMNFFLKCRADEPKLRIQRNASLLAEPGKKSTLDLGARDDENVFTVEFETERAPASQ